MTTLFAVLAVAVMLAALLSIPLGMPGNWIMLGVLGVGAFFGAVGVVTLVLVGLVAGVAELLEYLVVQRYNLRYGGSDRAFWGALAGGLIGVLVGAPIPVVGSLVAGFIGTFAGAALVTLAETRRWGDAARVGWGVLLARVMAAGLKTAAGVVILVVGIAAFVLG